MKSAKKYLSILTAIVLLSGILPVDVSMAAKKVALSDKKLMVTVGKTKTLKLKNNKKSVKWTVTSGKKNVTLKSKKKTSVKIVAKKKGTAKVQAKVGKKKYVCTVTVKAKTSTKKATAKPANTQAPNAGKHTPTLTPGSTVAPTAKPTPPTGNQDTSSQNTEEKLKLDSIKYNGKQYQLERDIMDSHHYMMELTGNTIKEIIPSMEQAEISATYMGSPLTDIRIEDVRWRDTYYEEGDGGYYSFVLIGKDGIQSVEEVVKISAYSNSLILHSVVEKNSGKTYNPKYYPGDFIMCHMEEGKSFRDQFANLSNDYTVYLIYRNKIVNATKINNLTWTDESYGSGGRGEGSYIFTATVLLNGVSHSGTFILAAADPLYLVHGVLQNDTKDSLSEAKLEFWRYNNEQGTSRSLEGTAITDEKGNYCIQLPEGKYAIQLGDVKVETLDLEKEEQEKNIQTSLCKVTGKLYKNEHIPWEKHIDFYDSERNEIASTWSERNGTYEVYLPQGEYVSCTINGLVCETWEVTMWNQKKDIECEVYKVTGQVYSSAQEIIPEVSIEFCDTSGKGSVNSQFDDGKYEFYLPRGNYDIYINGRKVDNIQITNEDLVHDIIYDPSLGYDEY